MNYYDVIFAQQKAKKDSKYFDEISDAINVLAGTETTYTPSEMASAILDAIPTETASGNPIHITDAANFPAEECVTTLEPVQDLHGYNKPWPAGGGKNLLPITAESQTINGVTFTVNKDNAGNVVSVTVNGTATANAFFRLGDVFNYLENQTYSMNGCPNGGSGESYYWTIQSSSVYYDTGSGSTFTIPTGFTLERVEIVIANGYTANNLVFKPMIRLASVTDPTFEPYSNECPISGHTGIELTRTGKNLLDIMSYAEWKPTYYEVNNDVLTLLRQDSFPLNTIGRPSLTLSAGTYSISTSNTSTIQVYNITTGTEITREPNPTFTLTENATIGIKIFSDSYPFVAGHVMLELGNTATAYEPYTPETRTQTFPQAQSPVYGCEVDWINGVLRVTEVAFTVTNFSNWAYQSFANFKALYTTLSNLGLPECDANKRGDVLFDKFKTVLVGTAQPFGIASMYATNAGTIYLWNNDDFYADEASMKQGMTDIGGVQFCYQLSAPLEIPLTPEVITLLKGENNVWTDAGTSEISYKVDLQSYIQKLIDEASAQASALSVSPLSLGKSAVLTSTDGEGKPIEESEEAEDLTVEDVESTDEADEVEKEPVEDKKADEPTEETEEAEDLTVKKEIAEELAETEKVEDIKETEEHESEVEE